MPAGLSFTTADYFRPPPRSAQSGSSHGRPRFVSASSCERVLARHMMEIQNKDGYPRGSRMIASARACRGPGGDRGSPVNSSPSSDRLLRSGVRPRSPRTARDESDASDVNLTMDLPAANNIEDESDELFSGNRASPNHSGNGVLLCSTRTNF